MPSDRSPVDDLLVRQQPVPEPAGIDGEARVFRRLPSRAPRPRACPSGAPWRRRAGPIRGRAGARRPCPPCPTRRRTPSCLVAATPGSLPTATASAQAADVLTVERHGARMPRSKRSNSATEVVLGRRPAGWLRRARAGRSSPPRWWNAGVRPRPMVCASKGRAGKAAVKAKRRSHAMQACRRPESRVRHRVHDVASHPGDRAGETGPAGQVELRTRARRDRSRSARLPPARRSAPVRSPRTASAKLPGRQAAARQLCVQTRCLAGAGQLGLEHAVGDLPALQPVELDRDGVLEVPGLVAQRDPSRSRKKARTG